MGFAWPAGARRSATGGPARAGPGLCGRTPAGGPGSGRLPPRQAAAAGMVVDPSSSLAAARRFCQDPFSGAAGRCTIASRCRIWTRARRLRAVCAAVDHRAAALHPEIRAEAESLQIDDAHSLAHCLATYYLVAWRLLYMTHLARNPPSAGDSGVHRVGGGVLESVSGRKVATLELAVRRSRLPARSEHYRNKRCLLG